MATKGGPVPASPSMASAGPAAPSLQPATTSNAVEYNHQHFLALINQLVDTNLNEEAKLKAAQEISYNLETLQSLPSNAQLIDDAMLKFIRILRETEPQFITESAVQQLRKKILELIQRITPWLSPSIQLNTPGVEQRNVYLKDLLMLMYTLIEKENEENVLICLKIMVDFHRSLKQFVVTNEGQQFFTFVKNSYRNLPLNLDTIFNYKPQQKVADINETNLESIINKAYTSFQLVAERPNQRENQICNVIPRGSRSLKVLAECPLNTVIMYQANKNYLNQEVGEMITLISNAIALQPTPEQRLSMDNKEVYTDFVTAQVKALSFIAYFKSNKESSNNLKEKIASHSDLIVKGMLQLLNNCPPELVGVRKDLLAVSRHILTELRAKFMPYIGLFFDEATFCGTGYTASELLRSNACSMVADFVHNVRKQLTHADLCKAITFFSKSLHDPLLFTNMQHMCCRVLINLIDCIKARDQENTAISTRDMILKLLQVIALKFKSIAKYQVAYLLEAANAASSSKTASEASEEAKSAPTTITATADSSADVKNQMEKLESFLGSFEDKDRVKLKYGPNPMVILSESDCRTTIRYLIAAARSITTFLVETKLAPTDITPIMQVKQLTSKEVFVYVKLLKYALLSIDVYMIGRKSGSTTPSSQSATQKEEKEIIESLGFIFNSLNAVTLKEIFTQTIDFIIEQTFKNPNIAILSSYFLATPTTSFTFATILIEHLLKNMETMGEASIERSNLYLKLFKLVFGSVSVLPAENEKMLKPHLHTLVTKSLEYALKAKEPYNYFLLLRALFRSIGGGNHDLLYQEFLPLLPILLQSLNELQIGLHKQHLKDLFVELCLTVPVRLSSLLPYLPMLMDPLVSALNGSPNLVSQGLRTLELCVDNLQPDFLYDHIQPVRTDLIQGLWRILRSPNEAIAQAAYRVLGKLGGSNRKMMIEPQKLKYNSNLNNSREFNGPTIKISFPNYPSSIELSLEKVLETCQQVLKTAPPVNSSANPSTSPSAPPQTSPNLSSASFLTHEIFYKKHAFKIVTSFLMTLFAQDSDKGATDNLFQNFKPFADQSSSFTQKLLKMKFDDEHLRHMVEISIMSLFYASVSTGANKEFQKQTLALLDTLVSHLTLLSLSYYTNSNQEAPSHPLSAFVNYNVFAKDQNNTTATTTDPAGAPRPKQTTTTQQQQPSPSNILDFMVLVDSIYSVLCNDDMEHWAIIQRAVLIMIETSEVVCFATEQFDSHEPAAAKPEWLYRPTLANLALFDYLAEKLCQLCYERSWFAKRAGCIIIKLLTKKMPLLWTLGHCYAFLRSIMFILVSVIGEISSGAIDVAQESLENLITICASKLVAPPIVVVKSDQSEAINMQTSDADAAAAESSSASVEQSKAVAVYKQCAELQTKCLNEIVKELIRQITSSNSYVRKNSIKLIRQISELQSKSVHTLIHAHLDVLNETVAPRKHLKLRHYSVQAQIGLLEGLEFCSSTQPQLFVFNMSQPDHSSLFQELMPICEGDENFLSKNICYKQNPNDLIPLRKAALNTFASFHHLLEQREHILSSLHRALASPIVEIQQTSFECLKKYIANTEAYSASLRSAANASQQPNPVLDKLRQTVQIAADYLRDYLHPLTEYKSLNVSVMQHLTYITQLYPTILNEKFSEYLLTHLRQWLDDANKIANDNAATATAMAIQGQVYNPNTQQQQQFKSLNNELKLCSSIIKLLAELQSAPAKLVETAISMLIKYEKVFMLEVNELFRAPLAQFLKRYPYETLKHLLNPDRIKDMYLYRFLIYLVKKQPAFMNIFKTDPNRLMQMLNESQNLLASANANAANAAMAAELTFKSNQLQYLSILILYRLVKTDETAAVNKPDTPSWTAGRAQLIDFLLNKIWTNERFHERHKNIDQFDHLYWKEPVYLVKIFLKFHTAQMKLQELLNGPNAAAVPANIVYPIQSNVELIFNLLIALQNKSIHQYEFLRLFFQDVVAKTYSCEWKRAAFFTFVKIFSPTTGEASATDPSQPQTSTQEPQQQRNLQFTYSPKLKANILQFILIPCFQHSFETNEHAQLIGGQPQPDQDSDDNIVSVFINKVIDPDNPYSISDSVRIFLLQLSSLFVQYAHDYIHDVNNKKQGTKLRRLMTFAWPCLLAKTCVDPFNKYHGHLLLSHIISKFAIHKRIVLQVFHSLLKAFAPEAKVVVRQALDILTPSFPTRMDDGYFTLATWTRKILIEESQTMLQLSHMLYIIVKYHKVYYLIRHALINNMISSFQKVGSPIQSAIENRILAVDLTEIILRWEAQRIRETSLLESAASQSSVKTAEQQQLEALIQKHPDMLKPFDKHVAECVLNFYIRLSCPVAMPAGDQQQQQQLMANTGIDALSKRCFTLFKTAISNSMWPYADLRLDYIEKILFMLELVNNSMVTNLGVVGTSAIQVPWLLTSTSVVAQPPTQQTPNYNSICTCLELITFLIEHYASGGGSNSTGTFLASSQTRLKVQNILRLVQRGVSHCIMCSNARVVRSVAQMVQKLMTIIPVEYFNHNPLSTAPNNSSSPGSMNSSMMGTDPLQSSPSASQQQSQPSDPIYQLFGQPDGILCRTIIEGISYYEKASSSTSISSTISSISSASGGLDAGGANSASLSSNLVDTLTNCLLLLKSASANNPQYIDRLMAPFMKILQKLYRDHLHSTGVLLQNNMAVHSSSTTQEGSNFMYIPASSASGLNPMSMMGGSSSGQHVNAWSELLIQSLELIKYRVGVMSIEMRKMFISSILVTLIDKSIDLRVIRYITRMISDWIKYKTGPLLNQIPSMKEKLVLLQKLATAMEKRFADIGDLQHTFLDLIAYVYKDDAYSTNSEFKIKLEQAFLSGLKCSNPLIRQQFFDIFNANFNCTDLYERLCYIIVTQNWEAFTTHYWIKQCIQITLGACARSDTSIHYSDLSSNRFYFTNLLGASSSLFQSAQEIAVNVPHGKTLPAESHHSTTITDSLATMNVTGDDSTAVPQSSLPIVMSVDATFGENSNQIWKAFALKTMTNAQDVPAANESGNFFNYANKRFIDVAAQPINATVDMMEVDGDNTDQQAKSSKSSKKASRADLIRYIVDNEFAFYEMCKEVRNSDFLVSICQLCHISSDMSHHLWLQLFIQMFNLLNTKQQQNLYGELTPFMASGSHRFQKQSSISTLNTFLESFSLAKPVSLFLRPKLLAYLAKNHNLWHRVCLLLESSIFSSNVAPTSINLDSSISASSIALINSIESIASQDSSSSYQQQTQHQTALQNVQHETFSSLVQLYKQLKEDDYKAGLWMKKSNHETTKVALIYEQQGLFYQAQKIYEEAIARSIDTYLNVNDADSVMSNTEDLLEFNTWEDGWIHCCKELNQWSELSEYALSDGRSLAGSPPDNFDYALSLECAWKTPSQQQQQTSMSDWMYMKQLLLSPQRDSSNMPRDQMWRWWLYQGYYLVCNPDDYHQFMINENNRQDQTQSSVLQAANSAAAYSSPSSVIESRVERCMSSALREWRRLPRLVSQAHMQLLQAAQQIVELQEAFQIQNNLNTLGQLSQQTHHINPSSILSEIKGIIKTWRTRLPLINDDLSYWNEIFTWRQYHYEAFTRFYEKQQTTQNSGSPAMLGVHALAQGIVHFGKIARKQHLYDLCLETLNKIHKKQSVPIIDCFLKVKQEIKCYINTFEYLNHKQANDLLEVIEATNLRYFTKENVAELISLKANYLQLCGKSDDANHLYSFSIYLNDSQAKLWGAWGDYLTQAYVSVCSTSLTPANAILTAFQRRSIDTAESALIALLHAARHPSSECKVRKYIAKIFWLLAYDDGKRQLYSTLDLYSLSIPSLHWINWIPQLITLLSRNDDTGKYVINIMNQIVRSYPLALYYPLRSLYLKMKNEEQAEKFKLQFQQQILLEQQKHQQQQQANAGSDVEMKDSASSLSSSPSTGRAPLTPTNLLQNMQAHSATATDSLIRVTTLMHRQREMHPTLFNTLEGLIDQLLWLKINWYEELLRNFKQTLQACYTHLFELTSSSSHHHHPHLAQPLSETLIDPFSIYWFKKLQKFYADTYLDKLQLNRQNTGGNTGGGSVLNNLINPPPSSNNSNQRFRGLFAVLNDPNYQLTRQRFMNDFNFVQQPATAATSTPAVSAPLSASVNIYAFIAKLRVWIKLFETYINSQVPKQQQLDERFKFVTQFCSTTADIEIPGEFLIPRNTNYYVRISRILPKVDAVEKYNSYTRRIYIRGHNGKLYPFLIANDPNYYDCRKEEHVMQLMRMMNTYLGKQKETSNRNLNYQLPRIVSLSVDTRMIEDDCSATSLLDIYKNRMRKLSAMMALNPPKTSSQKNANASQENRALLASEAGDLPLMRYFERLQSIPTLPPSQSDTPATNKQQAQFEKQLKNFHQELFKHISANLVPKTVLRDWAMFTYTDATDYFHFRKMFTQQLAIYGLAEYALFLTRLNPDQLYISQDTGVCQNIRLKFDLHESQLKQGQQQQQVSHQIVGFNPERPVPFRLTPNISEFITSGGINGPLSIIKIALVRCLLQPQYNFMWILRPILMDDIQTCYSRRKQEEAMKNTSLNPSSNSTVNSSAQLEIESENMVNLINKLVDQIENRLKDCGGLEGGKNHVISTLIPRSMSTDNLAQMDPLYYPWL